jgi:basic membrane lipoprotein Med (substrate-binding protein (PBP1-ABC) superfamily)
MLACCLWQCTKDDNNPEININVIYPIGGLGSDYINNIYKGIVACKYAYNLNVCNFLPNDMEEASQIIDSLLSVEQNANNLLVLADTNYGELLLNKTNELNNVDILLMDGTSELDIWSIEFSFYGASYLAGVSAAHISSYDTVAFIAGMPLDNLSVCYNGFKDGFIANGGMCVERYYLDSTYLGFSMVNEAEALSEKILLKTDLIVAAAGGSNIGVFNVVRELDHVYAIGTDSDQSHYAPNAIIGSIVKRIDSIAYTCIEDYYYGMYKVDYGTLGLKSEFMEFTPNSNYSSELDSIITNRFEEAVNQEESL